MDSQLTTLDKQLAVVVEARRRLGQQEAEKL
jgi:hypothetical protein